MAAAKDQQERIRHFVRRLSSLERQRSSWESHWREIAAVMQPTKGRWLGDKENDGGKRNQKVIDSTAIRSVKVLAAGMHGGLTSPSRPWFRLGLKNKDLEKQEDVKFWLQDTQQKIMDVFASSNFYSTVHSHYLDLIPFGTGAFTIEEDWRDVIRCRCLTVGEYCIDVDGYGRVDSMYRRFKMTARQIFDRFPASTPERVRDMAERDTDAWLEILHAIEPRHEAERDFTRRDGRNKAFTSVYILLDGEKVILEEDGYDEFPACCPRWEVVGSDVYGRSPGMDVLPDVNMLQRMRKDGLEALELEVKPPMNVSNDIKNVGGKFGMKPSFANFVNTNSPVPQISPTYQIRSNLQALDVYLKDVRQQIREGFYNDLFMLISQTDKRMTATEVAERNSEKLIMLGPVLERLKSELYEPLITRVFAIMVRYGKILPPPEAIQGQEWELEIISMLALAQKSANIAAIEQLTAYVGGLAQVDPNVLDKLDTDDMVDQMAQLLGVPATIIRVENMVEQTRAARAEAQAQQAQAETQAAMLAEGADIAQKLSNVRLDEQTAAAALFGAGGGGLTPGVPQGVPVQ